MPKLSQKSFVSGQYDRIAQNQESINNGGVVASGLSYSKNNLSSDKGELRKRLGTKFLKQLDGATVIVPFRNKEDDNILLFAQNKLDILEYKDGGVENFQQQTDTKVEKTWTSDTVDGYTVSVPTRGTSGNAAFNMFQNSYYPPASGSEQATHPFVGGYEYLGDMAGGGIYPPNQFFMKMQLPNDGIVGKFSVIFATTHNEGAVPISSGYTGYTNAVIQYSDDNLTWVSAQTIISSVVGNTPYYTWRFRAISGGIDTTKVEHLIIYDVILNENVGNHRYWRVYFTNPVDSHDRLYSQKLNIQFYTRTLSSYSTISTDITNLKNIKYSQSGNDMKLVDGEHTPKTVALNAGYSYSNFTPSNPGAILTGATPSCVQYFQNRLWFGGFSAYPTTVIASKFNNIDDFRYSTPAQTDDGLELKCNQLKSQISNLISGQNILYCFSQDGISNIDGASNGLATNSSVEFVLKNRMPAGDSTPAFKDDVMLYSSSDGTKLYGVDFDLLVNRFQVSDLAKYAKDITKAKITELHYVNNESKLVYGLTEEGSMFALLYEKGQYQGFFPLDFGGTVYDIAPIKVGRNYKLLMVVFRDGNWYLEEKLDMGNYIDTSTPRLTDEEKKWATYDNLENNIALDCYQKYDEGFDANSVFSNIPIDVLSGVSVQPGALDANGNITTTGIFDCRRVSDDSVMQAQRVDWHNVTDFVKINPNTTYDFVVSMSGDYYGTSHRVYVYDSEHNFIKCLNPYNTHGWSTKQQALDGGYTLSLTMPENAAYVRVYYFNQDSCVLMGENPDVNTIISSVDLSSYVGKSIMLANDNEKDFVICTVESVASRIAWGAEYDGSNPQCCTDGTQRGDLVYNLYSNERYATAGGIPFVVNSVYEDQGITCVGLIGTEVDPVSGLYPRRTYHRSTANDEYVVTVTMDAQRGNQTNFTKVYPEFTQFAPNLPQVASVGVISEGRYFNATNPDENALIYLPAPCHKVIYGVNYEALAILKIQTPYESLKQVAQVDVSVIDTTHLEVGTDFSDTQNIEKIDDSSYYDLTRITMNDTYRLVLSDTPETTKNLILRSNKGVPFTVIAVDMYVNYSNLGGD